MQQMTITEARQNFLSLPEVVEEGPLTITKRARPVMVTMGYDHYKSLEETLDILSDQAFSQQLTKSIKQAKEGKIRGADEVRRRLGL